MSLLINEPPLQVLPSLAVAIGLNEAIVIQQLHYLLPYSVTNKDGKNWVFNSIENWLKIFPFFSRNTLIRTFENLEKMGFVLAEKIQKQQRNQTKFYTIDYDRFNAFCDEFLSKNSVPKWVNPFTQNGQMEQPKMGNSDLPKMGECTFTQNGQMLQENTNRIHSIENIQESETAQKTTKKEKAYLAVNDLIDLGVDEQVAKDYLAIRKTKLTKTALNLILNQIKNTELNLNDALLFCIEHNWQSFKYDWYLNKLGVNHHANSKTNSKSETVDEYRERLQRGVEQLTGKKLFESTFGDFIDGDYQDVF